MLSNLTTDTSDAEAKTMVEDTIGNEKTHEVIAKKMVMAKAAQRL